MNIIKLYHHLRDSACSVSMRYVWFLCFQTFYVLGLCFKGIHSQESAFLVFFYFYTEFDHIFFYMTIMCECVSHKLSTSCHYLSFYLSIYEIYIAPLQGNYLEVLPARARVKIKVLRSL